jgi:uncharacterized membrane protein YdjX (TVP38/TMEM64 family)
MRYILVAAASIALFVAVSMLSQEYRGELQALIGRESAGSMIAYAGIVMAAIIVAPVNVGFLLPVAANVWGPFLAATLSVVGWTLGAMIAFWLSRNYGQPFVKKFVSLEKIRKAEKIVSPHYAFWSIVFLRMAMPVDILSYALGLFTSVSASRYFLATIIGVIPFGFLTAYASTSSPAYQLALAAIVIAAVLLGLKFLKASSQNS